MGKRRWLAAGGSALAATIGLLGAGTVASAGTASPVVGYTYIDGNTATANTVDGFARHADGSVTPLPGSPFAAGGAGTGMGLASQGAIQATPGGRYLLAVDAGSNQISVLRITAGGVPVLVGQPVSSGGLKPVSVAVSRSGLVYVANQGNGSAGSGYSGFRLGLRGTLTPIPGSAVSVPGPGRPGRRVLQRHRQPPGRHPDRHLADRQFRGTARRPPAGREGVPVHRAGPGPARGGVLTGPSLAAVRQQRAQRRGPGHRLRLPRRLPRRPVPDRGLAVRRRADRAVLGGDQPRRPVPVHGQHRVGEHLQLRHQRRTALCP